VSHALRTATRFGVGGVVLPEDFLFPDLPERFGLAVSSAVPLLRRLAAPLCCFAVEEAGVPWWDASLSLTGRRSTPELLAAAQSLAPLVKTLHIDVGEDTPAVSYLLRSRCGVAVITKPPAQSGNTFALDFTKFSIALPGGRIADGALLEPPRPFWKDWPAGCDSGALLAALLASGQINLADIRIRGLSHKGRRLKFPY
jgi:hypothetical protein